MTRKRAIYLYNKHKLQTLTPDERKEWVVFLFAKEEEFILEEIFDEDWNSVTAIDSERIPHDRIKSMTEEILVIPQRKAIVRRRYSPWLAMAVAASIVIAFSTYLFFYYFHVDIKPGGNYAQLTFPNGQKVELRSDKSGIEINEEGVTYIDGSILEKELQSSTTAMLVLETPRGGQYRVKLADGTMVFLNAASRLTYPANFEGKSKREVSLEGEGYFDVHHDADKPFLIKSDQQTIEVKGTQFVVSTYNDEPIVRTTLISGSVDIKTKKSNVLLKPNQQSILQAGNMVVKSVDVTEALAWTKGEFVFNEEKLEEIMRKISRWYDVEVIFQNDEMKTEAYVGIVSRFEDIDKVLKKLEQIGSAQFSRKGNTIRIN